MNLEVSLAVYIWALLAAGSSSVSSEPGKASGRKERGLQVLQSRSSVWGSVEGRDI